MMIREHVSRRSFLGGLAAAGATSMLPSDMAVDQARRPLIDVHHHYFPPEFLKANTAFTGNQSAVLANWTPAASLSEMDRNSVTTAMLSLWSIQGVWMGANAEGTRRYARMCNDYGA